MPGPIQSPCPARLTNLRSRPYPNPAHIIFCVQAVISPILANLYLHYVLDLWVEQWRKKPARGDVIIVR
jgi:hypothetical protein